MKNLFPVFGAFVLATACASDPNAHFDPSTLTPVELKQYQEANIILLGEQHDNPVHHQIQNEILKTLGSEGRLKSVVFEQVDWTDQGTLSQVSASNLGALPKKLEWEKSGWPDYDLYAPLFKTAVKHRAKLIAGGLPKSRLEILYKSGYEGAFTAAEIERLHIREPIDGIGQELVQKEIFEGHCEMIPEDHVAKMIPIQRARDAALVKGYQNEADLSGVTVFILGNGHARKEFGVPTLLRAIDPKLKVWSVGMIEVTSKAPPPEAFDKIWITEKVEREDPCVKMKADLEKKNVPVQTPAKSITPDPVGVNEVDSLETEPASPETKPADPEEEKPEEKAPPAPNAEP